MSALQAKFELIDEMSAKLEAIANTGNNAISIWEDAERTANAYVSVATGVADDLAESIVNADNVMEQFDDTVGQAGATVERMSENMEDGANTAEVAFSTASLEADKMADAIDAATIETEHFNNTTSDSATSAKSLADALEDEATSADRMAEKIVGLGDETQRAGEEAENFGMSATRALEGVSGALMALGITKALSELYECFILCSEGASIFETAVAKIETVADAAEKPISVISDEIMDLSRNTGIVVEDLSLAAYQAISASVDTAESVAFVATANQLAIGGFTDTTTAVDVLTTAINAYKLNVEDADDVANMLITTQNLGKTTVDEVASSIGMVIPVASAYNVEMDNLTASYALMTSNGIATAESTTYLKSMLNELGTSSSTVAQTIQDETGMSFALLMERGYSLGDVIDILGDSVDGDTTKFNELWSSTEAGVGALSLLNAGSEKYNDVLNQMQNSAGATEAAYATMSDTTAKAKEDMTTAIENLSIVIGDDLNPVLGEMYELGTDAFNWTGEVIEDYPVVTAGMTGLFSALSVGVGTTTAFTVAQSFMTAGTIANTAAVAAWNAVLAVNPVVLVTTGVVALTAGLVAFASVLSSQEDEYESWTASTKTQYNELERLNDEYEIACNMYGDTSEEALRLRYEVDDLTASFEENKQSLEDFVSECEALIESSDSLVASYKSSTAEIVNQEVSTLSLIQKLEDLAISTDDSATAQWQMEAIIAQLNEELPGLALSYDDVTSSVDGTIDAFKRAAEAQSEDNYRIATQEAYVALLDEQRVLEEQLAEAEANLEAERNRMIADGIVVENSVYGRWAYDVDEYSEAVNSLTNALNENEQVQEEMVARYEDITRATEEAEDAQISYEDAVSSAVSSVSGSLETLASEYDAAYESALSSIEGTIGLFQTMATESELSTNDMLAAFESQLEYLNLYNENLEKASEYSLDEGLISSLSDGSEESAGYLNAIIEKIDELGGSTQEANDFIDQMNASFLEVKEGEKQVANTLAEMEKGFAEALDAMEEDLLDTIEKMTMDAESKQAAKDTMTAYIDSIRDSQADAESAAAAVANAVNVALGGQYTSLSERGYPSSVAGYATGTGSAATGLALVGEEGPELVYFSGGETVVPSDETANILGGSGIRIAPAESEITIPTNGAADKKITIEINGSGGIGVDETMTEESIVALLYAHVKPVLTSIVQQEIFEEGSGTYDF